THGDIFPIHGAKMTPVNGRGGSRAFPTEERSKPSPEWNHYRIECVDGNISLAVNGKVVTKGTECWPKKGYICLESEGGVVHYRNLRIKELPDTPIDEADVAIANRGYRCLYSGVDLAGWKTDQTTTKWKSTDWVLSYSGENGQHDAIESTAEFQDYGFIFDVRRKENSEPAEVFLRGKSGTSIVIDPADAKLRDHLAEPGKWNRFEGTINGNQLTLKLNDNVVWENQMLDSSNSSGSFRIEPNGAIDFANIYVRSLAD
ncbi:MAG: DUF1080 domain-containing protein, partial [Planctomycetales bacterium]|nr:DUF1080 domain-containing protein [Planctomycetales bacterium]